MKVQVITGSTRLSRGTIMPEIPVPLCLSGYFQAEGIRLIRYFSGQAAKIDEKTVNSAGFFPGKRILGLHNRPSSAIIGKCVKSEPPGKPAGGAKIVTENLRGLKHK